MSIFDKLLADSKNVKPGSDAAKSLVEKFAEDFHALSAEEKAAIAKQAKDAIAANPDLLANINKSQVNATAFAFQTVVYAIENDDGRPKNTFPEFSKFKEGTSSQHPDGRFGPLTNAVYLGTNGEGKDNALTALVKQAEANALAKTKAGGTQLDNTTGGGTSVESEADKAARLKKEEEARLAAEEAKKPKPVNASADDVAKYTFKRAQVQYYEEVLKENPAAKGLTVKQMQGISDAVRSYAFNEDGTLKTKNDDGRPRDYKNATVQEQLREAVREKTHELGLTDAQIANLNFSVGSTKTRSIVGSFTAATNAAENADKVLSKSASLIKAHFDKPENKEFLDKAGVKTDDVAELTDVREDKRGVYFKTNFVPPLQKLAKKEADEITKEYAEKIANEKAKLAKFEFMDKIVNIGFPRLVEVQLVKDGVPQTKDKVQIDYDATGKEIKTTTKVPVMDPVKRADEKQLVAITPDLSNKALKDALVATGLVDEKGNYKKITYSVEENGQKVEKTVSADEALKDPKKYNEAIKAAVSEQFAFTDEEKKKNVYGGANLDKNIVNSKIKIQKDKETTEVAKEIIRLETERGVKIENSPSNVMLRDAFDPKDSQRVAEGKSATSALGKYEEAIKFYNLAAAYETERQIDELTGSGASRHERKDLKQEGNKIEKILASRVASAKSEVKGLEEQIKAETDETKKGALSSKLEAANTNLKSLTEIPKDFDQKDKVQMINVNVVAGGQVYDLIHVDAKTAKELKQAKADEKKAREDAEKAQEAKENAEAKETKAPASTKQETAVNTPVAGKPEPAKAIVELTDDVNALIAKVTAGLSSLTSPALAVDNQFDDIKDKAANKNWDKAVKAVNGQLEALKKLSDKDAEPNTDYDAAVAKFRDDAAKLGVVVTDDFKVEKQASLQNIKAKNKTQGVQ